MRDERGSTEDVVLHPGTVIVPRGLRLERGMQVTVRGQLRAASFAADEVIAPHAQVVRMSGMVPMGSPPYPHGYVPPQQPEVNSRPVIPPETEPAPPPAPRQPPARAR